MRDIFILARKELPNKHYFQVISFSMCVCVHMCVYVHICVYASVLMWSENNVWEFDLSFRGESGTAQAI